ncbi:MAG: hypothetical protein K9J25_07175 [Bacteroidales bacterium]|nr:hypothetical protein [Bacteroidales bacterium]
MSTNSHTEDLKTIRKIMEESSRFLSLSGLSGIFPGIFALIGFFTALWLCGKNDMNINTDLAIFIDAVAVLSLALITAIFFSYRKAKRKGFKIWTTVTKSMLVSLAVPLLSAAILILVFYMDNNFQYIVPSMLIFYGIALVSAGKFMFGEIIYLGILEIITGFVALFLPEYGLYFWGFGFGILHIVYGTIMYRKYM